MLEFNIMKRTTKAKRYINSLFDSYTYNIKDNLAARWGLFWSVFFLIALFFAHYLHDYVWLHYPGIHFIYWILGVFPVIFFPLVGATGTL